MLLPQLAERQASGIFGSTWGSVPAGRPRGGGRDQVPVLVTEMGQLRGAAVNNVFSCHLDIFPTTPMAPGSCSTAGGLGKGSEARPTR